MSAASMDGLQISYKASQLGFYAHLIKKTTSAMPERINAWKYKPREAERLIFCDPQILDEMIDENRTVWHQDQNDESDDERSILALLPRPLIETAQSVADGITQAAAAVKLGVTQGEISHRLRMIQRMASFIKNMPDLYKNPIHLEQKTRKILDERDANIYLKFVRNGNILQTSKECSLSFSQTRYVLYQILLKKLPPRNTLFVILKRVLRDGYSLQWQEHKRPGVNDKAIKLLEDQVKRKELRAREKQEKLEQRLKRDEKRLALRRSTKAVAARRPLSPSNPFFRKIIESEAFNERLRNLPEAFLSFLSPYGRECVSKRLSRDRSSFENPVRSNLHHMMKVTYQRWLSAKADLELLGKLEMPDHYRRALSMRLTGTSCYLIAQELNSTVPKVKSICWSARKKLYAHKIKHNLLPPADSERLQKRAEHQNASIKKLQAAYRERKRPELLRKQRLTRAQERASKLLLKLQQAQTEIQELSKLETPSPSHSDSTQCHSHSILTPS